MSKTPKPGLGARLEARFRPSWHWGAEFLEDRARICGFREKDGQAADPLTFEGTYAEAEAFARAHGLAYEGLYAAVSHVPFKTGAMEAGGGTEEEILAQAERLRPTGLALDALDVQVLAGEEKLLVLAREDALRSFRESLPAPLGSLWGLTASPLALLPFFDAGATAGHWAALLPEESYTHILFFRGMSLEAHAKVFSGLEEARREPAGFAREMKKALVYHFGSRYPGAALEALQIWKDGVPGKTAGWAGK